MAFNVGLTSKDAFKELKKMAPRHRFDFVRSQPQGGASYLSSLTPAEFAELFPNYFRKGLPDVSGFRAAISQRSSQKQDDINFGLANGAKSIAEAENMGSWRRRFGGSESSGGTVSMPASAKGRYSVAQAAALARSVGATPEEAQFLGAVTKGESSGIPTKHNPNASTGDDSYGLWQVNMIGSMGPKRLKQFGISRYEDLYDPKTNAKAALIILREQGRGAWGAYRDMQKRGEWDEAFAAAAAGANGNVAMPTSNESESVSKVSSKSGGFYGESEQCVALSKHFSGLGAASSWKVKSGTIVAGTVIATMSYNDGSGGKMASSMPDGKSHYHTGIALNAPDANGNVLILEQFAGQPARVRSININNYNGEKWGVVEGGEPNAGTMKAVELGKQLANPDQLALIGSLSTTAEVKPMQEAPMPGKPTATTNATPPAYPADQQQTAPKTATATVEKVDKAKKTYETFKFDPDKYWNEVKTKQPMADSMFYGHDKVMQETYKGFEEAQAAGAIKFNRKTHEIQILDPNHEKVQQIYKDMQDNNIDRNQFLTKTEAGGSGTAKVGRAKKHSSVMPVTPEERAFNIEYDPTVGSVAQQFEGRKGVETISSGMMRKGKKQVPDPGGVSYGAHQLSSRTKGKATGGTMAEFLKSNEGQSWSDHFKGMKPGTKEFSAKYSEIISNPESKKKFAEDQHKFIYQSHYVPIAQRAKRLGYDIEDPHVKEALYSASVQYRNNARSILARPEAMAAVGKPGKEQATAIYDARNAFGHGQFASRMKDEKIALANFQPPVKPTAPPVAVAQKAPAIEPQQTATVSPPAEKGFMQRVKEAAYKAIGFSPPSVAEPKIEPKPQTQAPVPAAAPPATKPADMAPGVYNNPDANMLDPTPINSLNRQKPKDKQSFEMNLLPNQPQKQVSIDGGMHMIDRQFSSPSLERAMKNLTNTSGASDGHFGGNNLA